VNAIHALPNAGLPLMMTSLLCYWIQQHGREQLEATHDLSHSRLRQIDLRISEAIARAAPSSESFIMARVSPWRFE
jgi:hypothetical protein